jgi:hypothetical protein
MAARWVQRAECGERPMAKRYRHGQLSAVRSLGSRLGSITRQGAQRREGVLPYLGAPNTWVQ